MQWRVACAKAIATTGYSLCVSHTIAKCCRFRRCIRRTAPTQLNLLYETDTVSITDSIRVNIWTISI
uniref:hypothetical protein n=1 Tax=Brasilonema sp. UFV-L1 TaxID=2234130 RepID=UPI0030D779BA